MAPLTPDDFERLAPNRFQVSAADGKLKLPRKPDADDYVGLREWLTNVFNLDHEHPVSGARGSGHRGPNSRLDVERQGTGPITFEPRSKLASAASLTSSLDAHLLPTDGEVYGFTNAHCHTIGHVCRMLAGVCESLSDEQETEGIVGAYLLGADQIDGLTAIGTSPERYEVCVVLRTPRDRDVRPRYVVDEKSHNLIVPIGPLTATAREQIGGSVPHGWLDGRMQALGWRRLQLQGWDGTNSGRGRHAHIGVYIGQLNGDESAESEA